MNRKTEVRIMVRDGRIRAPANGCCGCAKRGYVQFRMEATGRLWASRSR